MLRERVAGACCGSKLPLVYRPLNSLIMDRPNSNLIRRLANFSHLTDIKSVQHVHGSLVVVACLKIEREKVHFCSYVQFCLIPQWRNYMVPIISVENCFKFSVTNSV